MKLDRFIINYNGNKYLEVKKYLSEDLEQYKNYDIICEPCCGIFGFSRAFLELVPDYKGEFWLNDINTNLINDLTNIKNKPEQIIKQLKEELSKYKEDKELSDDKNKSRLLHLITRTSNQRLCNISKGDVKIKNYEEKINDYKIFFDKVKFYNLDCNEFIKQLPKNKKILIFFDPPYFDSNNTDYQNKETNKKEEYTDNTQLYVNIYETFKNNNKLNCIMIINKIEFLNYFFNKWKYKEFTGKYQMSKNIKKHIIYKK